MITYADQLHSAKLAALAVLFELLVTTEDPIEKRRIATAILRVPNQHPRGHAGATEAAHPTAHTAPRPPKLPTQHTEPCTKGSSSTSPHPTSAIPHPTFPPLSSLDTRLDALHAELDHHLANLLNSIPDTAQPTPLPCGPP